MKIALYIKKDNPHLESISKILTRRGVDFVINPDVLDHCQYAVSVGGDGTFLGSVRSMGRSGRYLPLLGVNSGRLGFLASISVEELDEAIDRLSNHDFTITNRTMLQISGIDCIKDAFALNEFTAQRDGASMIKIDCQIDGVKVASYWADGIIVSTPTGSTAYSMSVGGAIISPNTPAIQISPIAPHNLSLRPLIVNDNSTIELRFELRSAKPSIITSVDNFQYIIDIPPTKTIKITRSPIDLPVIGFNDSTFYTTLQKKLHWANDPRN